MALSPRWAVAMAFLLNGFLFGAWAARIPDFKIAFELSPQMLSFCLLMLAGGAILSFSMAGYLADRFRADRMTLLLAMIYPVPFIFLPLAPSLILFMIALLLFGFCHGAMDVTMNAWGSAVEQQAQRNWMPFFHAMFSIGAALGAGIGSLTAWLSWDSFPHFALVFGLFYLCLIFLRPNLPTTPAQDSSQDKGPQTLFALPSGLLWLVALIAMSAALGEGAVTDWIAVFMRTEIGSSAAEASLAYGLFSVAMVIMRLSGQALLSRYGIVPMVRFCAFASFTGAVCLILTDHLWLGYGACLLLGVGYAILMPLAFSKAAQQNPHQSGKSIAAIALFAYGGLLLGPALIGFIAEATSLQIAFGLFPLLSLFVFISAFSLHMPRST